MELIVELVNRSQKMIERHKFDATRISIGRAFDNDLIISEPHVCPHHAVLQKNDDGNWYLEDLGSRNGTYKHPGRRISGQILLQPGDEFIVGKMRIRIFNPDFAVKPAIPLSAVESIFEFLSQPFCALLVIVTVFGMTVANQYLHSFNKINASEVAINLLAFFMSILVWASLWTFFGRLLRHETRFITQFIVTACVFILFTINEYIGSMVAFNSLSLFWINVYDYLSNGLLLVLLFTLNLRFAIQQNSWKRGIYANIFAWSITATLILFQVAKEPDFRAAPIYVQTLLPIEFLWKKPVSKDQFIKNAGAIFTSETD